MLCQQFELIGTFLHVVITREEETMGTDKLRKIWPLHEHIKSRCSDLYQPQEHLAVDKRMVKS